LRIKSSLTENTAHVCYKHVVYCCEGKREFELMHNFKFYGEVAVHLHSFLILALDGDKLLHAPAALPRGK